MLQILLLAFGIVYLVRRVRIDKMTRADIPAMSEDQFVRWKQLQLKSINWFLFASFGSFLAGLMITVTTRSAQGQEIALATTMALILGGLIPHAIYWDKAKKVQTEVLAQRGLNLPS